MKKYRVVLLTITLSLLTVLLSGCTYGVHIRANNELKKADGKKFIIEKSVVEPLKKINISSRIGDIEFIEDDNFYVEIDYYYWKDAPEYKIENGVLSFDDKNTLPNSYSINFDIKNTIKVYLPKDSEQEQIILNASSGNVSLACFTTEKLETNVSYGDVVIMEAAAVKAKIRQSSGKTTVSDFQVGILGYNNSYGNATFTNINTGDRKLPKDKTYDYIELIMSSGNCSIDGLTTKNLVANNSYGDITCKDILLDEFNVKLSSGDLTVTKSDIKESDIKNSYGDVDLSLIGTEKDYELDLKTSYGSIKVGNKKYDKQLTRETNGTKSISANLSSGNITINYKNK